MVTRTTDLAPGPPVAAARRLDLGLPVGLLAVLLFGILPAAGCSRRPTEAAGPTAQLSDSATVSVPPPPPGALPRPAALPGRPAGYVGVVLARQAVTVAAEADGRLASVLVRVGDAVRRGQELAALATDVMHDEMTVVQATVAAARGEEPRAELELDRTRDRRARRELHPELYAEEDLASARNAAQQAAATGDSAKA